MGTRFWTPELGILLQRPRPGARGTSKSTSLGNLVKAQVKGYCAHPSTVLLVHDRAQHNARAPVESRLPAGEFARTSQGARTRCGRPGKSFAPPPRPETAPAYWTRSSLFSRCWSSSWGAYAHAPTSPAGKKVTWQPPPAARRRQRRSFRFHYLFLFRSSGTPYRVALHLRPRRGRRHSSWQCLSR